MLNKRSKYKNALLAKSQRGLVLFMALIALVAMSLAAAALVRSVDSGVLVAGNLAFKQSAILSAETGVARAYNYIKANTATLDTLNASGYFAVFNDAVNLTDPNTWSDANSILLDPDPLEDTTANETRVLIQRMCNATGAPDQDKCLVGTGNSAANSQGSQSEGGGAGGGGYGGLKGNSDAVVYRATVRVKGPKNTYSYLQAFIY